MEKNCVIKVKVEDLKVINNHSDANASEEDVLTGKTFYSKNKRGKQTGTMNPGDYAPIQSISKNGDIIPPDEDKNVDIVISKEDVGLNEVDNTSDMNKPISISQQKKFNRIDEELLDKPSLQDENTYTGKQNFNGELEINAPMEVNSDINVNNSSVNIIDAEEDIVTKYFSDKITLQEKDKDEYQIELKEIITTEGGIFNNRPSVIEGGKSIDVALKDDLDAYVIMQSKSTSNTSEVKNIDGEFFVKIFENDSTQELNNLTINEEGISIDGKIKVRGDVNIGGTVTVIDTETLKVKDNIIITNADGIDLVDLSGLGIRKNSSETYGIVYDTISDSVKLGLGKLESDGKFSFDTNEGSPIATRADDSQLNDGHLIKWSAQEKKFIDCGNDLNEDAVGETITKRTKDGALKSTPLSDISSENQTDDTVVTKKDHDKKVDIIDGKQLSTNDFTNDYKSKVDSNTTTRHSHSNKSLLDTYTQTEVNLADSVAKKHSHSNKTILDNITASYTADEKTALEELIAMKDEGKFGNVDDVKVDGISVVTNKIANIDLSNKANRTDNLSQFTQDAEHRTVTDTEKATWDSKLSSYTETDPTVPAWAKQETKPEYDYSEIKNTPVIPSGLTLYETTGTNSDGAMTQKAVTDELSKKISTNTLGVYVGTTTSTTDSGGNFGQASSLYNTNGEFYATRKFVFNSQDFVQSGDDNNKIYSLAEDVARKSDIDTAIANAITTTLNTEV